MSDQDPKIVRASVHIKYRADDGCASESAMASSVHNPDPQARGRLEGSTMNLLRELLTCWSIGGRPLAHPITLARRFGVWPLMTAALLLTTALVAIGFGRDEAADFWRRNV